MRIWTEAAKAAQRAAIRSWQPWAQSTGPRTVAGKAASSRNACKPGCETEQRRATQTALRLQRNWLKTLRLLTRVQKNSPERTIIIRRLKHDHLAVLRAFAAMFRTFHAEDWYREGFRRPILPPPAADFRFAA